eukprot:scaffold30717_cov64-Phaeocystis_antarctica.AAC.3
MKAQAASWGETTGRTPYVYQPHVPCTAAPQVPSRGARRGPSLLARARRGCPRPSSASSRSRTLARTRTLGPTLIP